MINSPEVIVGVYGDTDKGEHGYMPYYRKHLGPLRFQRNTVFEIGVGGYDSRSPGGSLAVWRDYLPFSTIVGLDIHEKNVQFGRRVHFIQADQSNHGHLEQAVERFGTPSIVIDDGSHVGEHINATFDFFWPRLASGAVYVIEDLSTSYYPGYGGADPAPADTGVGLTSRLVDDVQALDPTFRTRPDLGSRSAPRYADVAEVHSYPGITFVSKA